MSLGSQFASDRKAGNRRVECMYRLSPLPHVQVESSDDYKPVERLVSPSNVGVTVLPTTSIVSIPPCSAAVPSLESNSPWKSTTNCSKEVPSGGFGSKCSVSLLARKCINSGMCCSNLCSIHSSNKRLYSANFCALFVLR